MTSHLIKKQQCIWINIQVRKGQVNYQDYGILAKWLTWGIPLHEGHLFGIANKIINLLVCLAFLGGIILGFLSWFKRLGRMKTPQPLPRRIKNRCLSA